MIVKSLNAQKRYHYAHFDSVDDLIEMPVTHVNEHEYRDIMNRRDGKNWFGIADTAHETLNAVRYGWPEGLHKAERTMDEIPLPRVQGVRRRKVRGDFGNELDIHRVYAGSLDTAWQRTERVMASTAGTHNATVLVEMATSAKYDASQAFWRGAAATLLTNMLQASGRNVRVLCMTSTVGTMHRRDMNFTHAQSVTLKDYTQPLDLDLLMACTSVGFNRTLLFKSKMVYGDKISSSYGRPVTGFCPDELKDGSLMLRVEDVWTKEDAVALLKRIANQL